MHPLTIITQDFQSARKIPGFPGFFAGKQASLPRMQDRPQRFASRNPPADVQGVGSLDDDQQHPSGHDGRADALHSPDGNQQPGENHPQNNLQHGGDHREAQASDAAEEALDDLSQEGKVIRNHHGARIESAGGDNLWIGRKDAEDLPAEEKEGNAQHRHQEELGAHRSAIIPSHPLPVSVPQILGNGHHHGSADALGEAEEELLHAKGHVVAGDPGRAERGKHPLDQKAADHDHRLLQGRRPGIAQDDPGLLRVELKVRKREREGRRGLFRGKNQPQGGQNLAEYRRAGHAVDPQVQDAAEKNVQQSVDHRGYKEYNKRSAGVPGGPEGRREIVVEEAEDESSQDDGEIAHGLADNRFLRPLGRQNPAGGQKPDGGQGDGYGRTAENGGGMHLLHLFFVPGAAEAADKDADADTASQQQGVENIHHR